MHYLSGVCTVKYVPGWGILKSDSVSARGVMSPFHQDKVVCLYIVSIIVSQKPLCTQEMCGWIKKEAMRMKRKKKSREGRKTGKLQKIP